jgi:hypothetical protein
MYFVNCKSQNRKNFINSKSIKKNSMSLKTAFTIYNLQIYTMSN